MPFLQNQNFCIKVNLKQAGLYVILQMAFVVFFFNLCIQLSSFKQECINIKYAKFIDIYFILFIFPSGQKRWESSQIQDQTNRVKHEKKIKKIKILADSVKLVCWLFHSHFAQILVTLSINIISQKWYLRIEENALNMFLYRPA